MHWARVHSQLAAIAGKVGPSVRAIGLAYTGLGGMIALALVVSVALVPVAPALQQAAEPARQAVSNMVQPTTDAVTTFFGGGPVVHADPVVHGFAPDRAPEPFADAPGLDMAIQDGQETMIQDEPPVVMVAIVPRAFAAETDSAAPEAVDEIVGLEPVEVSSPHPVEAIVKPAPVAVLQIASQDVPKALPTLPAPTETPRQVKARMDVENQAAIDAAKAAQAHAKAEADAANNAAIAAHKAASPVVTAEPSVAPTNVPKAVATLSLTPQSNTPATHSTNQAAIEAAKLADARAKAQANAANQAAIDAAKAPKGAPKATSTPTAQSTPSPAQPTPTTPVVESQATLISAESVEHVDIDEATLEDAPMDQASTLADAEPA